MLVPLQLLARSGPPTGGHEPGDVYFDTDLLTLQVWDGFRWNAVRVGERDEVTIEASTPTDTDLKLWVDVDEPGTGAGGGGDGSGAYLPLTGGTVTGQLVGEYTAGYSIHAKGGIQSDDEIWVTEGGVTIDNDFLSVNGGNVGGATISGGFEVYHDPATMPNRAIGFWRKSGSSYGPLMAEQSYEPVTKAHLDETVAAVESRIWHGTQAEYDAITTKNPETLYVIVQP